MPAHTAEGAINQVLTSEGLPVTEDMWWANQLVDFMAKQGAGIMRHGSRDSSRFLAWETQVKELLIFLGQLTHAANGFLLPNGEQIRDSEAATPKVRSKMRSSRRARLDRRKVIKVGKRKRELQGRDGATNVQSGRKPLKGNGAAGRFSPVASIKAAKLARHAKNFRARQAGLEAFFLESWCEQRASSMKPSSGPSASERLDALRGRIAARGGAESLPVLDCCKASCSVQFWVLHHSLWLVG